MAAAAGPAPVPVLDGRDWARRLIARFDAGQTVNRTALRFAHEALGLPLPRGCR